MAIITLTSDIGTRDFLIGAIKGRLLNISAAFSIIDISHDISPYNYSEAVYIIRNSFTSFPKHTWHLLLVNLFDTNSTRLLLAHHQGYYFACADNGLLPMVLDGMPEHLIYLDIGFQQDVLTWVSMVGKVIADMEQGQAFYALGKETDNLLEKHNLKPIVSADYIEGRIIFIDRFENVVVNITRPEFEEARHGRDFSIVFKGDEVIGRLSNGYSHVAEGSKLAFFNTAGYLEIAVNKGNAAGLFGLQIYNSQVNPQFLQSRAFYQTVRIHFH